MSSISKVLLETLILYLLICCFFLTRVIRINRKPEKSEHKLFQPASPVSCEQHSYGGWAPQPLTLIQPFTLPSIRTDLCFTKIIHSLYSFDPPSSPTSPILCSCDRSQQSPGNLVHHNEEGLRLPYSMTEDLKKKKNVSRELWKHWINCQMVFSCVSWPELWSSNVDSRDISLPVTVVLLSTLTCLTLNSEEFLKYGLCLDIVFMRETH